MNTTRGFLAVTLSAFAVLTLLAVHVLENRQDVIGRCRFVDGWIGNVHKAPSASRILSCSIGRQGQ